MTKIEMILEMRKAGFSREQIQQKADVSRGVYNAFVSTLRKRGRLPPGKPTQWTYTGEGPKGQIATFRTLKEATANGFDANEVGRCVRGQRTSYAGYVWTREPRE